MVIKLMMYISVVINLKYVHVRLFTQCHSYSAYASAWIYTYTIYLNYCGAQKVIGPMLAAVGPRTAFGGQHRPGNLLRAGNNVSVPHIEH